MSPKVRVLLLAVLALVTVVPRAHAAPDVVEYELVISEQEVAPAGTRVRGLVVNGSSPGPVLRFHEGDTARIRVTNALEHEETSIHWHGLLVPNEMDGVPRLTTPPIGPGESHDFEFTLRQAGTYWYHSHTALQEQRGVLGAIVIEPAEPDGIEADRDHVLVLSDWTNESTTEVMRTLMRGSEAYSRRKGTMQSIVGASEAGALDAYFARERDRMPAMDVSDVAYDAFLANGERTALFEADPGERVRLRIVNAGASTYFYVSAGEGGLTIVAADGQLVEPLRVDRLLIGMAETYDVLVTVPPSGGLEVRATSQDGSGHATARLGDGPAVPATDPPRPDLYDLRATMTGALDATRPSTAPRADTPRPPAPYRELRARASTAFDPALPRRDIEMRLTGDMTTYRWGFDGKAFYEEPLVPVREGEVVRITLVNDTMMHHPIHLHGHFFRVVHQGDEEEDPRAPLKHTVDVPPMGTRVIEFLCDEPGDWLFHCHLLYHMDAGMTRVVSYRAHEPDHTIDVDPGMLGAPYAFVDGVLATHMSMGMAHVMWRKESFGVEWDLAFHGHHGHDPEREVDLFWRHYVDANLSTVAGYRFSNVHGTDDRVFGGIEYRWPYMVRSSLTFDGERDARLDLVKVFTLTENVDAHLGFRYDTNQGSEVHAGFEYALSKRFSAVLDWHSDHGLGLGVGFAL
ncbi:MAG: multicopper oxidase domain-containing protein [Planctomycetota bacterium]